MNERVTRRFIYLVVIATFVAYGGWLLFGSYAQREPGDFETEMGSNRLEDGLYEEALEYFDQALAASPNHRGALMGRALVFIHTERYDEAIAELEHLIAFLERNLEADDPTGRGALAAAHGNLGIVYDRQGKYEKALESYIQALNTDSETVSGPGVIHKILYGSEDVSTIRERAQYIYEQLQLPEAERLMRLPEIDAKQRTYKP